MSNDKDKEKIETIKMVIDGRITRKEVGFKLKKFFKTNRSTQKDIFGRRRKRVNT